MEVRFGYTTPQKSTYPDIGTERPRSIDPGSAVWLVHLAGSQDIYNSLFWISIGVLRSHNHSSRYLRE